MKSARGSVSASPICDSFPCFPALFLHLVPRRLVLVIVVDVVATLAFMEQICRHQGSNLARNCTLFPGN